MSALKCHQNSESRHAFLLLPINTYSFSLKRRLKFNLKIIRQIDLVNLVYRYLAHDIYGSWVMQFDRPFKWYFNLKMIQKKSERSEGASEASIWATSTYHYIWSIFVFLCVSHNSSNWLDILLFCSWMMRFDEFFQSKSQFNQTKKCFSRRPRDITISVISFTKNYSKEFFYYLGIEVHNFIT